MLKSFYYKKKFILEFRKITGCGLRKRCALLAHYITSALW